MMAASVGEASIDLSFARKPEGYIDMSPRPGMLTFDDIPEWVTTYFQGRMWLVSDKGENVCDFDGRHLELWAMEGRDPQVYIIHEDMVNGWLGHRVVIHFNVWDEQQ